MGRPPELWLQAVCSKISAPRSAWKEQASCKERHRKDQTAVKSIPQRAWVTRGLKPGKTREQAGADEANGATLKAY